MLARSQDAVAIGGTSVTLTLPPGFSLAGRGLDNGAGSTITISERAAETYAELAATFSSAKNLSAAYAAQGVTIRAVRQIRAPVGPVLFASGTQSFKGKNSLRYFALHQGRQGGAPHVQRLRIAALRRPTPKRSCAPCR